MTTKAALQPKATPIVACTIARDVQNFDLLIEDMEAELGESWGDLDFNDAASFLGQSEADSLEFVAVAVDNQDEDDLALISDLILAAKKRKIKVILIADDVSPAALHQLLKLGASDFVPYPLPEGALHEAIVRARTPDPEPQVIIQNADGTKARASGKEHDGSIFAVQGLAGGTGASVFAVNLAWELAIVEKTDAPRVCLLDFDFQMGSTATYLDLPRKESVYELLSDTSNMDRDAFLQSMVVYGDKLHVLTAPPDMLPLDIVTPDDIQKLINLARLNFDFVIVDMPKTVVAWTETVLHASHIYFTLMEMDMRSAQNALRFLRVLKSEELPFEKLRFGLNRAPKFTDLSGKSRVKRLAESLDVDIELQLPDGSTAIMQACDHGIPLAETAAKNPLRKEIAKLARSLFDVTAAQVKNL